MSEVQSLESVIKTLTSDVSLWNRLMIWGLAIAAGAAVFVVIATRVIVWKTEQLSETQDSLGAAKDRQLASDLRSKDVNIAEAQRGAAQATVETFRLTNENLVLQSDILKLRARLADRRLSREQRVRIRDAMRKFPPQSWQVITFSNDGEARGLYADIEEALVGENGAGWAAPSRSMDQTSMPIRGLLIEFGVNSEPATRLAASGLVEALRSEKLAEVDGPKLFAVLPPFEVLNGVSISRTSGVVVNPNRPITVIVGRKP